MSHETSGFNGKIKLHFTQKKRILLRERREKVKEGIEGGGAVKGHKYIT